jgi:hypothetical protein
MTKRAKLRLQWGAWGAFASVLTIVIAVLFMHTVPAASAQVGVAKAAKAQVTAPATMAYIDVTKVPIVFAPASQSTSASAAIAPVKPDDPKGAAEVVRGAMRTSNWRLVVLGGLLLTVLLLRKVGGWFLPGRAAAWVNSDRGGAALALLAGVLTVVVNGLISGKGFDPQLLIDGVLAAFTAAGAFNVSKKLAKPSDQVAAPPAA